MYIYKKYVKRAGLVSGLRAAQKSFGAGLDLGHRGGEEERTAILPRHI